MSTNYEMCFCDTKISSQNVFEILDNLIKKAGWIPVAEVNCLWAYGPAAPAFGQPGGGTQYEFSSSIQELVNAGILEEVYT